MKTGVKELYPTKTITKDYLAQYLRCLAYKTIICKKGNDDLSDCILVNEYSSQFSVIAALALDLRLLTEDEINKISAQTYDVIIANDPAVKSNANLYMNPIPQDTIEKSWDCQFELEEYVIERDTKVNK